MDKNIEVDTNRLTPEQMTEYYEKRQGRIVQTVMLCVVAMAILSVIVPLGVWLTRGAMGLW